MGLVTSMNNPKALIMAIIFFVVGIQILVATLPDIITGLINISQIENLGFASFFASNGVALLLVGVAVLLGVLGFLGLGGGKR